MTDEPEERSPTFHPRVAGEILRRIALGESLLKICGPERAEGYPEALAVYNWLARYPEFSKAYQIARLAQAERYADQVIEIADAAEDGGRLARGVRRDRLRVEARRWRAAVLAPEVYAARLGTGAAQYGPTEAVLDADRELIEGHVAVRIASLLETVRARKAIAEGVDPFPRGGTEARPQEQSD